jgi:hypothetical protein
LAKRASSANSVDVLVVALATLVVAAHDSFAIYHIDRDAWRAGLAQDLAR